jgi:hypothetical protein
VFLIISVSLSLSLSPSLSRSGPGHWQCVPVCRVFSVCVCRVFQVICHGHSAAAAAAACPCCFVLLLLVPPPSLAGRGSESDSDSEPRNRRRRPGPYYQLQHSSTLVRKLLPVGRGCIRYSLRMGFKTLSFARYLAGRLERPAVLPCVAQTGMVLSAAIRLLGITRGVSFQVRVRGQSSPHRAKPRQRLSPVDHPVMEIVPNH